MNWRKRAKVCRLQAWANNQFKNHPIGGVEVKNELGETEYLNSHPKTHWAKQLLIAEAEVAKEIVAINLLAKAKRANRVVYKKPPENDV